MTHESRLWIHGNSDVLLFAWALFPFSNVIIVVKHLIKACLGGAAAMLKMKMTHTWHAVQAYFKVTAQIFYVSDGSFIHNM